MDEARSSIIIEDYPQDEPDTENLHMLDDNFGIEKLNILDDSQSENDDDGEFTSSDEQQTCARVRPYIRFQLRPEGEGNTAEGAYENDDPSDPERPERQPEAVAAGRERRLKKRKNFCPFCEKVITNYSRHLVQCHNDREEVKDYIALSEEAPAERKIKRTLITNKIRNSGNRKYNQQVVEGERNSELLPVKRSSKHTVDNTTHVTCNYCSGLFKKISLYKHLANCTERPASDRPAKKKNTVLRDGGTLLLRDNECANRLLKEEVFPKMQKDKYTIAVQDDSLICKFGSNFRFNHRGVRQIYYCSTRMRALARLFLTMKNINPEIVEFRNCIEPKNFDILVESVRRMSKFDSADGSAKTPTVPSALCSSLKSCANIVKSDTIKNDILTRAQKNEIMREMDDFLHLMNKDWSTQVSSNSEKSRKQMKVIKEDLLPDSEDIRTFNKYIHDLCPSYVSLLRQLPTTNNYEKLAKLIIVHIISFNRRRPNETVEITLEAYQSTLNKRTEYGKDAQNVLTEEELRSGEDLSIFYVPANKNTKKVPVLLTKIFHEAVDVLIESRDTIGVTSKYLFGRPEGAELFDGSAVLREFANKAGLKCPSTFTANALRHHAATSSQLQPHNETYTKRLSKFMGHDLKTHENYYEMPLPLIQKYKVGHKLLEMIRPSTSTRPAESTVVGFASLDFSDDSMLSLPEERLTAAAATAEPESESSDEDDPSSRCQVVMAEINSFDEPTHDTTRGTERIHYEHSYVRRDFDDSLQPKEHDDGDPQRSMESIRYEHSYAQWDHSSTCETEHQQQFPDRDADARTTPGRKGLKVMYPRKTTAASSADRRDTVETAGPSETADRQQTVPEDTGEPTAPDTDPVTDDDELGGVNESALLRTPPKRGHKKMRWTDEEKKIIYEKFSRNFVMDVNPPRREVKKVWEEEAALKNRTLQQVVTFVNNIFTRKQYISTPMRKKIKNMVTNKRTNLSP